MDKGLLKKFFDGTCSKEEMEYVYDWLSNPDNKEAATAIMKVSWDNASSNIPEEVKSKRRFIQQVLQENNDEALLEKMNDSVTDTYVEKVKNRDRSIYAARLILKVAASIALIFMVAYAFYFESSQTEEIEKISLIEKSNPIGRKSTIKLPDGSKVKLNSDSKIRYSKTFGSDSRDVILEGEAFFEVERDITRPFIVRTGDVSTMVLGTSFNISAYANSDNIKVAVVSGKVKVQTKAYAANENEQTVYLTPNYMAIFGRQDRILNTSTFDLEEIAGWKDGIIIFNNAGIKEISEKLRQWYGVDIEIEHEAKMMDKRYTGRFENNSLEYVLKTISYTSDINFELENDKVKLKLK
ncbi:MAG: FecR domain-containing protein [Cytophagales bacterium]|nr:FecR domain-containing protein [Cytophagales bacterium]